MPTKRGHDKIGNYYQYGRTGKKYYYIKKSTQSRNIAKKRADKQGMAIKIRQLYKSKIK